MGYVDRDTSLADEVRLLRKEIKEREEEKESKKKEKKFSFPFSYKSTMKKSAKEKDKILVWHLTRTGVIEPPKLMPVIEGNMVVINGIPHDVHPKAIWNGPIKNTKSYIFREIDCRPVSNLDWKEIKQRGDLTDHDVFLTKQFMTAKQIQKPAMNSKMIMIIIGVIIAAIIIASFLRQ